MKSIRTGSYHMQCTLVIFAKNGHFAENIHFAPHDPHRAVDDPVWGWSQLHSTTVYDKILIANGASFLWKLY